MPKKDEKEEALWLVEPPMKVIVIAKGAQQSRILTDDGVEQAVSNEWLVFEITDEMEEEFATATKPKAADKPAPVRGRHGKVAVFVNGESYDSVRRAFNVLKLPLREKSRVRRALRNDGKATVKYQDTEFKFTRVGDDNGDDSSAVDC